MLRRAMVLTLLLLAGGAAPLLAQVRYKDSSGVTHWVDSIDRVPEQYRAGAAGTPSPPPRGETQVQDTDKPADPARAEWQRVVKACAASVQSNKEAAFAAYVSPPGRLQMIGTQQGKYWFGKCMAEAAQPLEWNR